LNLIVTCGRNLESEAKNEIKKIINELGDQELEILDSGMRGVLTVNTVVKPSEVIDYVKNKIKPAISKRKIIICDRFIDSTLAYQVYGKGVNKALVDSVHKHILESIKPDLTFILKVNISKALERLKKRKKKNRYDKFSKSFYIKAQNAFIKIAKKNKKRYFVLDNSKDSKEVEKIILNKFIKVLHK